MHHKKYIYLHVWTFLRMVIILDGITWNHTKTIPKYIQAYILNKETIEILGTSYKNTLIIQLFSMLFIIQTVNISCK